MERRCQSVEAVIVGAGHAGLAMSYGLSQRGVEHLVLEQGDVGRRWREERWDSLTLLTPNWATQLPGFPYDGGDPDGFESRDGYVSYLERYARSFGAPVQRHTQVTRLGRTTGGGYRLETSRGAIEARHVVVATGPFQTPMIPVASAAVPQLHQVHTSAFRHPSQLPDGAVLVVGGGNSGLQIVLDLLADGRRVFVSVGRLRSMPRRYRGLDAVRWQLELGALDITAEQASPEVRRLPPPLLSGVGGGHDLNLKRIAARGAMFVGRLIGARDGRVYFDDDLAATLLASAESYRGFRDRVDQYVSAQGLERPLDPTPCTDADLIPEIRSPITELNLEAAGIRSIVWATGFAVNYDWIDLPIFGSSGEPAHVRGVTAYPGLYFLGLRWLSKYKSFFIYGVGEDALRLADHIAARRPPAH